MSVYQTAMHQLQNQMQQMQPFFSSVEFNEELRVLTQAKRLSGVTAFVPVKERVISMKDCWEAASKIVAPSDKNIMELAAPILMAFGYVDPVEPKFLDMPISNPTLISGAGNFLVAKIIAELATELSQHDIQKLFAGPGRNHHVRTIMNHVMLVEAGAFIAAIHEVLTTAETGRNLFKVAGELMMKNMGKIKINDTRLATTPSFHQNSSVEGILGTASSIAVAGGALIRVLSSEENADPAFIQMVVECVDRAIHAGTTMLRMKSAQTDFICGAEMTRAVGVSGAGFEEKLNTIIFVDIRDPMEELISRTLAEKQNEAVTAADLRRFIEKAELARRDIENRNSFQPNVDHFVTQMPARMLTVYGGYVNTEFAQQMRMGGGYAVNPTPGFVGGGDGLHQPQGQLIGQPGYRQMMRPAYAAINPADGIPTPMRTAGGV